MWGDRFINPCFAKALASPHAEGNPRKVRAPSPVGELNRDAPRMGEFPTA